MCPDRALASGLWIDSGVRSARVLRMLLMMVVDRGAAAASLEGVGDVEVLWPSSVFSLLAASPARSPQSFRRAARLLDDALSTLRAMTPVQLAARFASGRDSLSPRALAAIVWELLRRRDPAVDVLIDRVAAELELIAAQCAGAPLGVPGCTVEPVLASSTPRGGSPHPCSSSRSASRLATGPPHASRRRRREGRHWRRGSGKRNDVEGALHGRARLGLGRVAG